MWVFDATPLIYLAKADRLTLVDHLDATCSIPEPVHEEVVETGLEHDYPDARRIERCIEDGVFDVHSVPESPLLTRLHANQHLSRDDAAVLASAEHNDGTAVMDETYGRDVAATEGIPTRGTAFLVLSIAKQGDIATETARATIDDMLEAGWYCAPEFYAKILRTLETLQD